MYEMEITLEWDEYMSSKADRSKLALVIGIDVYRSEGLDNLSSCKKDAEDVCKLLQELGYTIFQNEPIIGSRLNKENSWVDIHRAIVSFFKSAKPGQTLLFYFSGHGIPREDEIYLAMPEVNTQEPMVEGFSLTKLTQLMKSSKSMQIVSIIDACYSGAAVLPTIRTKAMVAKAKETAGRALAAYDRILDNIPKAEGRCFLLSSQAYEPSLAAEDNYSLYTRYLIEGLRGAKAGSDEKGLRYPASVDDDGNVTPETLHKYLYHKVANEAEQVPKIKTDMASNIILAHHSHLAKNKPNIDSIVKEGDEHFLKDEYDKAIECYDKAIEADPYVIDAWHKKGNALYNKENYDEAIECYDRASLINPNHFDSWYKKGLTYKKKNNHDQAIKCYDRAIQIRANSSTAWYEKGISLSYFKRYEDAIKCYDNAIELNPKHVEAWYRKGYAFYEMQQDDEALRCYNRAKEIDPDLRNEWYGGGSEPPVLIPPPRPRQPVPEPEPEHPPPFSQLPPQQPSSRKSNFRTTIVIIAVSAAAVVGLLLAFAGGNIFSPSETKTTPPPSETKTTPPPSETKTTPPPSETKTEVLPYEIDINKETNLGIAKFNLGEYEEAMVIFNEILRLHELYPGNVQKPELAASLYNKGLVLEKLGNLTGAEQYKNQAHNVDPNYKGGYIYEPIIGIK
jgi:tetratricopeptide (TPR) repeat protein